MTRRANPYALPTEKRKRLSKKRRAQLFLERGGRCHRCRRKIQAGERWIAEHYVALQLGGANEWTNWDLTCTGCFVPKNRDDAKKASKGRRLREGNAIHAQRMTEKLIAIDVRGEKGERSKHRWPKSRPMPGSKASGLRKKLNGRVERR